MLTLLIIHKSSTLPLSVNIMREKGMDNCYRGYEVIMALFEMTSGFSSESEYEIIDWHWLFAFTL